MSNLSYVASPRFTGHVRIHLNNGGMVEESQDHPRGGPDFPLTREELEAKFWSNAGLLLPNEKIERIVRDVARMAAVQQVTSLMKLLTP